MKSRAFWTSSRYKKKKLKPPNRPGKAKNLLRDEHRSERFRDGSIGHRVSVVSQSLHGQSPFGPFQLRADSAALPVGIAFEDEDLFFPCFRRPLFSISETFSGGLLFRALFPKFPEGRFGGLRPRRRALQVRSGREGGRKGRIKRNPSPAPFIVPRRSQVGPETETSEAGRAAGRFRPVL